MDYLPSDKTKGFPKISPQNWFALRDKFNQKVPGEVTASYVATALGMEQNSARSNVVAPLRSFGIINEDGTPLARAYDWRDDSKYREVCHAILNELYPQELLDLFPGPEVSSDALVSWFMRNAKVGQPAARMYAQTFQLLMDGESG